MQTFNDLDKGSGTVSNPRENDVRSNLEQTINKTLQSKWNVTMGNSAKKSLFPNSIYNSNYDLNDNPSNDIIQTVGNRNATANATASNSTFIDVNGAASLDVLQSITSMHRCMEIEEKSISIKNRCGDAPSYLRLAGNKRQANIISNGINSQPCWSSNNGQRRRRLNNSEMTFESVQPMKTQCETLCEFVCENCTSTNANPFNNSTYDCIV